MISFLLSAGSLLLSFGQEINETAPYSKCEGSEPEHIIFKPIDTHKANVKLEHITRSHFFKDVQIGFWLDAVCQGNGFIQYSFKIGMWCKIHIFFSLVGFEGI